MTDLTDPERFAGRLQAKRYRARILKRGICSACTFREVTLGVYHCRNKPERQGGCKVDGQLPKFRVDDEVIAELGRAA